MITIKNGDDLYGLSTDTKPTNVSNATMFVEIDTGKIFFFDEESNKWLEF